MIDGEVGGLDGLDAILDRLRRLRDPRLLPLAGRIGAALVEGNRAGLLAGTDGAGRPLAPLAPSTIKRGGSHSPLLPQGESSPLIASFTYRAETTPDGARVLAGWSPVPPGLAYQRSGTGHAPARDPVGIRPETIEKIKAIVGDFARDLLEG